MFGYLWIGSDKFEYDQIGSDRTDFFLVNRIGVEFEKPYIVIPYHHSNIETVTIWHTKTDTFISKPKQKLIGFKNRQEFFKKQTVLLHSFLVNKRIYSFQLETVIKVTPFMYYLF